MKKKLLSLVFIIIIVISSISGCTMIKERNNKESFTIYLWSANLLENYAPYIQSQFPDLEIQFVVGQNDLSFYDFMSEYDSLPDIIMCRRFSRHDAMSLKDNLMDLSTTENAGAVYESYLRDFTNSDGTINWLPMCGTADGIIANKALFEEYNIPIPTDYESFVYACKSFEEVGIRGFLTDFVYDYTCMEVLQGFSISEITSMDGSMWRNCYEDPEDEESGLDNKIWPVVFQNMEKMLNDVNILPKDLDETIDYGPICEMFRNGQLAMMRHAGNAIKDFNEQGIEAIFLPYFCQNNEQWILTYPEFQVALNKKLETDSYKKEKALEILTVMLSEEAQKIISDKGDIITYNKNVNLEISPYLNNIVPIIKKNHLYIRIASNDFFSVSKDVVHKMIKREYNAEEAYKAFDTQLRQSKKNTGEIITTLKKGYSNVFDEKTGVESFSAMANTVRNIYESEILIAPAYSFSGILMEADYTEKQISSIVLHGLVGHKGQLSGARLKQLVSEFVEDNIAGFTPFNKGSLPIVSGINISVEENDGKYKLIEIKKNGKIIKDTDVFSVVCLNYTSNFQPILNTYNTFDNNELFVKKDLTGYIKEGGSILEPENYITVILDK